MTNKNINVWPLVNIYKPEPSPFVSAPKPPRMFTVPQEITPVATFNASTRFLIGQFPRGLIHRGATHKLWSYASTLHHTGNQLPTPYDRNRLLLPLVWPQTIPIIYCDGM